MAQESCNLDKEEAEILKPSSPPSSPPPPTHKDEAEVIKAFSASPTHQQSSSAHLFMSFRKKIWTKRHEKLEETIKESKTSIRFVNRCLSCRRKVGLTGFRCRCGHLFCGQHRYSDSHDCSFDYKALGKEQISKANPVIRAAKIIKI